VNHTWFVVFHLLFISSDNVDNDYNNYDDNNDNRDDDKVNTMFYVPSPAFPGTCLFCYQQVLF